jgi:hypothetical protein
MTEQPDGYQPPDELDELVHALLECGAPLSQIVSHLVMTKSPKNFGPGFALIPEEAGGLVRDAIEGVARAYTKRDLRLVATMLDDFTEAMHDNLFLVPPGAFN